MTYERRRATVLRRRVREKTVCETTSVTASSARRVHDSVLRSLWFSVRSTARCEIERMTLDCIVYFELLVVDGWRKFNSTRKVKSRNKKKKWCFNPVKTGFSVRRELRI